jgi:hypothetical protein
VRAIKSHSIFYESHRSARSGDEATHIDTECDCGDSGGEPGEGNGGEGDDEDDEAEGQHHVTMTADEPTARPRRLSELNSSNKIRAIPQSNSLFIFAPTNR